MDDSVVMIENGVLVVSQVFLLNCFALETKFKIAQLTNK